MHLNVGVSKQKQNDKYTLGIQVDAKEKQVIHFD